MTPGKSKSGRNFPPPPSLPRISPNFPLYLSLSLSAQCAAGVAYETPCQKGLAYSPEQHVCNYPDSVSYCDKQSEGVVGFKCPGPNELPPNAVARR